MNDRPGPDGVQMVRQQDPAHDSEGMFRPRLQDGVAQGISFLNKSEFRSIFSSKTSPNS